LLQLSCDHPAAATHLILLLLLLLLLPQPTQP
jgi:hypothetical protein